MNKKEHSAALAAAEAELARLQAIVPEPEPEPDVPLMVLSAERVPHSTSYFVILFTGEVGEVRDTASISDNLAYARAACYSSKAQAKAYARAFRTLSLIRRQPGIAAAPSGERIWLYYISVDAGRVAVYKVHGTAESECMFPRFCTLEAARAAITAVGEEELRFCANFLAGNITLEDYTASTQPTAQTGE